MIPQTVLVRVPACKASPVPRGIMADKHLPWLISEIELTLPGQYLKLSLPDLANT